MDYSEEYKFSDFTLKNYKRLLELALENYNFCFYTDKIDLTHKTILLRHDIEFSIPIAEKMAEIEYELGIKATYFLQIHSEFYNPFEKANFNSIIKIIKMGHKLGLHFDSHFWNIETEEELEQFINIDKETIEKYFGLKINVFSFHNTNKFVLSCDKDKYSNLLNVYSKKYKEEISYCTDSLGYWRFERLEDKLKDAKDYILQILTHDGMWQNEILSPRQRIFKVIDDRATYLKKLYDNGLKKFGVKNIDIDKIF